MSSTDERTSEILIEPNVFPIDWTQNPICLKACKEAENDTKQIDRGASDEVDDSLTTELTKSVSIQDSISPPELLASATTNESKTVPNGSSSFDLLMKDAPYDYVLLTDCVFSKELAVPLVNSILCCCGPRTSVICCHEIRDEVNKKISILIFFVCVLLPFLSLHFSGCKCCFHCNSIKVLHIEAGT